jgi:hypothetical protein
MRKPTKRVAVLIAATVLLAGGGIAYAYWTAGGSGAGTATTGTNIPITANQTTLITGLAPGVAAQTISGTFTNTNTGPAYVGTVTASIGSVAKAGGAPGTCDATDYTLASPAMTVNAEVPAGTAQGAWTGATIAFNDKTGVNGVNQDACKGATVTLSYAIS